MKKEIADRLKDLKGIHSKAQSGGYTSPHLRKMFDKVLYILEDLCERVDELEEAG